MGIMKIDVDALEQAAAAVGPEQWFEDGTGTIYLCPSDPVSGPGTCGMEMAEVYLRTDGKDGQRQRFIAAANPAAVLELVLRLRAAERALSLARPILAEDRQALLDGHTFPGTNEVEDCAREPLARYNEALAAIDDLIPH